MVISDKSLIVIALLSTDMKLLPMASKTLLAESSGCRATCGRGNIGYSVEAGRVLEGSGLCLRRTEGLIVRVLVTICWGSIHQGTENGGKDGGKETS